ncbi:MAG: radical SAM protein [Candidatus Thermoplasmatota archaeon]|jgi:radical SAM superfamily enzyme YgiQ (UPF0313 family)|nr:radical SAM protein [Candidatus Thermoplasmatota archaeon]
MNILIVENVSMGKTGYGFFDKKLLTMFSVLPTLYARHFEAITPKKYNVEVVNERYNKIDFDNPYDIVHINYTTSNAFRAYEIADSFRQKGVTVVLSGMHASALPDEAKKHADSVLLGYGELSWLKLLEDFSRGELKPFYQPVKYDDTIRLPPTDIKLPGFVLSGAVEATRGCPYKCAFCREGNITGSSQFYKRPVDDVMLEIKNMPQKFFTFYDNSLTIDPDYTKSLFTKISGLHKKFSCNGNVDVLANDKELVRLSKEAGCVSWLIGFESVSQKTLDEVGKRTNKVKNYKQAVKNIHDNGMVAIGCFVFGFDTDTKDVFDSTLKFIKDLKIDIVDFLVLTPFPGTPLFECYEKEGRILTRDWSKYNMRDVVFKPKNMTHEELLAGVRKLYTDFYSTGHAMRRVLNGLNLGLYPFFLIMERNISASMNKRMLSFSADSMGFIKG